MDSKWIIKLQQLKQFDLGVAVGGGVSQQSLVGSPTQIRHTGEVRCNTGGTWQGRAGVCSQCCRELVMWSNSLLPYFARVLSCSSCPTLCDPIDCGPPSSSVHGILQVRILEWVAMPSSRRSSQPRGRT